ncbi:MAG: response regulator [Rhodoferax sp.]|nr:response regulator [Rhodoferax sp.]
MLQDKEQSLIAQLKKANILVIDDFQGMRTMLRNMVKDVGGVKIDTAASGKDAISQLKLTKYDIIICDYNLGPGPNGQQLLEEARLNNYIGAAAVWIMVTAEKTTDMVMGAAEVKPDDYILKPINQDLLQTRLEKLILRKKSLGGIETALKAKDYMGAIEQCDLKIREKPANLQEILRIRSDVLLTLGRFEEAAALFESVLALRSVPWAKTGLGKVKFHTKDYEAAKRIFGEVLADNRIFMEASDWLVKTLDAMGDTVQAQKVLQDAVGLSPNSAVRQKALGEAAYKNGDLDLAQTAFEHTIKISEFSPHKSAAVFAGLAKVFSEKNSPVEALNVLKQGKREFKDSPGAEMETAIAESMVYQKMGQQDKALEAMAQAQQLKGSLGSALSAGMAMEMARAQFRLGNKEAAAALLRDVVKNNHDSAGISAQVQALFESENLGDEGRALIHSSRQEVININNQGVALGREGKLDEAIALLRQALQEMPGSETVMMNLCGLLIVQVKKSGRSDERLAAIRDLLYRVQLLNPANKKQHEYTAALNAL